MRFSDKLSKTPHLSQAISFPETIWKMKVLNYFNCSLSHLNLWSVSVWSFSVWEG